MDKEEKNLSEPQAGSTDDEKQLWKDRKRTFCGLPWSFTKYALTDERLFIETGFFTSREDEVRLYRIMDVELTRTLRQKIWGLGTIRVHSSDKSLADFEIKNIKNSHEIKEMMSKAVERQRDKKRVVSREMMMDSCDIDDDGVFN